MKDLIWYVEAKATPESAAVNCGTAVAIRLKPRGATGHAGKRYLLTCSHVIRDVSSDDEPGFGPVFDQIHAWKPDSVYKRKWAHRAIVSKAFKFPLDEIPRSDRSIVSNDWVLLEVEDPRFSTVPTVTRWASDATEGIQILGYPGGEDWIFDSEDKVLPRESRNFRIISSKQGALSLDGPEETRPGMSGGGLFAPDGSFLGLHRSFRDNVNVYRSVSAAHIRTELAILGLEAVDLGTGLDLSAVDSDEIPDSLPFLVNRTVQVNVVEDAIKARLRPKKKKESPRRLGPTVMIVYGDTLQAHGMLVNRIRDRELPCFLPDRVSKTGITRHDFSWPEIIDASTFKQVLTANLCDAILEEDALIDDDTPKLLNQVLSGYPCPVILTTECVVNSESGPLRLECLEKFLEFWDEWPASEGNFGKQVFVFVLVKVEGEKQEMGLGSQMLSFLGFRKQFCVSEISGRLRKLESQDRKSINPHLLPELMGITHQEAVNWAKSKDVKRLGPISEKLSGRIAKFFRGYRSETKRSRVPMIEIAEVLEDMLEEVISER